MLTLIQEFLLDVLSSDSFGYPAYQKRVLPHHILKCLFPVTEESICLILLGLLERILSRIMFLLEITACASCASKGRDTPRSGFEFALVFGECIESGRTPY